MDDLIIKLKKELDTYPVNDFDDGYNAGLNDAIQIVKKYATTIIPNGNNRFWIEIKCPYEVYDDEWAELLFMFNHLLKSYDGGKFTNVGAYLCERT